MNDMIEVFKLEATARKDVSLHTTVMCKNEIEYFTWIHIPHEYIKCNRLCYMSEITEGVEPMCILNFVSYEGGPWFKVLTRAMNMKPGFHLYRMQFVDIHTNETTSLYFAYMLQDNKPERPYLYMNPDERTCCCGTYQRRVDTL